jgi:hypothetical protein
MLAFLAIAFRSDGAELPQSNSINLNDFNSSPIKESTTSLEKRIGKPNSVDSLSIEGTSFTSWVYFGPKKQVVAEFLIQAQTSMVVEKIFHPTDLTLKKGLESDFKGMAFEKIKVRCRHHSELVLLDRSKSLMLVTSEHEKATIDSIIYGTPELVELRLKENEKKVCKNRWEK